MGPPLSTVQQEHRKFGTGRPDPSTQGISRGKWCSSTWLTGGRPQAGKTTPASTCQADWFHDGYGKALSNILEADLCEPNLRTRRKMPIATPSSAPYRTQDLKVSWPSWDGSRATGGHWRHWRTRANTSSLNGQSPAKIGRYRLPGKGAFFRSSMLMSFHGKRFEDSQI